MRARREALDQDNLVCQLTLLIEGPQQLCLKETDALSVVSPPHVPQACHGLLTALILGLFLDFGVVSAE